MGWFPWEVFSVDPAARLEPWRQRLELGRTEEGTMATLAGPAGPR
jgi:hypothetical protein